MKNDYVPVTFKLKLSYLEKLDHWCAKQTPERTRSDKLRELVERFLKRINNHPRY